MYLQGSVHLLKHDTTPYWSPIRSFNGLGDTELVNVNMDSLCVRKTKFKNIETDVEYTFRVSTLIDGITISRKRQSLKPNPQNNETNMTTTETTKTLSEENVQSPFQEA